MKELINNRKIHVNTFYLRQDAQPVCAQWHTRFVT